MSNILDHCMVSPCSASTKGATTVGRFPHLHPPQPPSTFDGSSLTLLIHAPCDVERVEAHATSETRTFRLNIILRIQAK